LKGLASSSPRRRSRRSRRTERLRGRADEDQQVDAPPSSRPCPSRVRQRTYFSTRASCQMLWAGIPSAGANHARRLPRWDASGNPDLRGGRHRLCELRGGVSRADPSHPPGAAPLPCAHAGGHGGRVSLGAWACSRASRRSSTKRSDPGSLSSKWWAKTPVSWSSWRARPSWNFSCARNRRIPPGTRSCRTRRPGTRSTSRLVSSRTMMPRPGAITGGGDPWTRRPS
jgi:hypothetical protein